jgi:hypothetical protein
MSFLEVRIDFKKPLDFFLGTEPHHPFHAGTVVPAAIENDDFTGGPGAALSRLQCRDTGHCARRSPAPRRSV